ncbi:MULTISPECIES: rubrerythrin [Clostridium]|uniref:Rubrerythrin family protein n=1 Tax=Clostridium faecium TaxID=2762223 RepID=A0ABR8YWW6_9CLOT|nr:MULTISPECIES: rubrerythrin family protein [Clostridium]MBD8048679.1 rubrerythrin family protein [Clostridium faecium]MDU1350473.1 rubrerythrin family protein [Clostridium argentinense]
MNYKRNDMKGLKGSETEKNLLRTFAGESRASNKYMLFAEKAKEDGYQYVAEVFEETSGNERAHSRVVYRDFLKQVRSTANNLMSAIKGETEEFTKLYKEYEDTARKEGFNEIADFYKELREVEESHEKRFQALYDRIKNDTMFKSDKVEFWQCMNCGYIHEGKEAPNVCPLCKYPRAYFKIMCRNYEL